MHDGPIRLERTRNGRGVDPAHREHRTVAGSVLFAGLLAAGIVAISYPITAAVVIGVVGSAAWSTRWLVRRLRAADGPGPEQADCPHDGGSEPEQADCPHDGRSEPEASGDRSTTVVTDGGNR